MTITGHDSAWNEVKSSEDLIKGSGDATFPLFVYSNDPGNDTEANVREYLKTTLSASYFGLTLMMISVDERVEDSPTRATWRCTATYGTPNSKGGTAPKPRPGEEGPSFTVLEISTSGGRSINVKQSLELIEEATYDDPAANPHPWKWTNDARKRMVGLTRPRGATSGNFSLEGVPISLGVTNVTAYAWKSNATVSAGYIDSLCDAAGRNIVNLNPWKFFKAKTLKFISFTSKQQIGADAGWDFSYSFEYQPPVPMADINVEGLEPFTGTQKEGHHYLDIQYGPRTINNVSNPLPQRAAIHKIFPEQDYASTLII